MILAYHKDCHVVSLVNVCKASGKLEVPSCIHMLSLSVLINSKASASWEHNNLQLSSAFQKSSYLDLTALSFSFSWICVISHIIPAASFDL